MIVFNDELSRAEIKDIKTRICEAAYESHAVKHICGRAIYGHGDSCVELAKRRMFVEFSDCVIDFSDIPSLFKDHLTKDSKSISAISAKTGESVTITYGFYRFGFLPGISPDTQITPAGIIVHLSDREFMIPWWACISLAHAQAPWKYWGCPSDLLVKALDPARVRIKRLEFRSELS